MHSVYLCRFVKILGRDFPKLLDLSVDEKSIVAWREVQDARRVDASNDSLVRRSYIACRSCPYRISNGCYFASRRNPDECYTRCVESFVRCGRSVCAISMAISESGTNGTIGTSRQLADLSKIHRLQATTRFDRHA